LKDEEAMDWCKRISRLSLDKGNKLKGGHGGSPREMDCVNGKNEKEKEEENEVGERLLVLVCGGVHEKFMKK
jgi:hypothetical protein